MFIENTKYEVLTPQGFKSFLGINTAHKETIKITTDKSSLVLTRDHKVYQENMEKQAGLLRVGEVIDSVHGLATIQSIEDYHTVDVGDLVEVEDTHAFYANDLFILNCLVLDELAHVEPNVQVDFFQSVYPTISSGKSTKIIITSTPRGMELFYKLWTDAIEGRNSYKPLEISWTDVPGRDEKWKKQEIANLGSEEAFNQEYSNQFLGSTNTLITGNVLRSLTYCDPINTIGGCKIFEMPQKNRVYTITVDVAHGAGQDYSAFSVVDVTDMPYKVVATFYKNDIPVLLYPTHIFNCAKLYNNAVLLVEVNDIGQQIASIIKNDFEYDNILYCAIRGQKGQQLGLGYGTASFPGVKMTKTVKKIGCAILKTLIEEQKIILNDFSILYELYSFISKADSFEAEEGKHDDLVMSLVIFAWMSIQPFYKELINSDIREKIFSQRIHELDEEILPFYINNGIDHDGNGYWQETSSSWNIF